MTKYKIYLKGYDFGASLSNTDEVLLREVAWEGDIWIEVEERAPGVFTVVDNNFTEGEGDKTSGDEDLVFLCWEDEVKDLDGDSDEAQCFGMSYHLVWNDVDMTPDSFRAPSIERLLEALNLVVFCSSCGDEI
jgi:hypothetical protein